MREFYSCYILCGKKTKCIDANAPPGRKGRLRSTNSIVKPEIVKRDAQPPIRQPGITRVNNEKLSCGIGTELS
jgi:hypothetical protein